MRDLKNAKQSEMKKVKRKKSLEIAKSMFKDNIDVDIICKHTKLSKEKIEALK